MRVGTLSMAARLHKKTEEEISAVARRRSGKDHQNSAIRAAAKLGCPRDPAPQDLKDRGVRVGRRRVGRLTMKRGMVGLLSSPAFPMAITLLQTIA